MKMRKFSLRSRIGSFRFAINGLGSLLKFEHNSRIHLLAAFVAVIFGIILNINAIEWCLLIIVIGLVFTCELINSSLETLADITDPTLNDKIRTAKDYAAAAVLISSVISVVVGVLIFIPKILILFHPLATG